MKKSLFLAIMLVACLGLSAHKTGIYFYFDNVEKHVYEDENVRVFLYPSDNGRLCVLVNNKTNKVVYVDNGSSFLYTNGKAASLYRAKATTSGGMSSSGVAVNLGGMASAMGMRGSVATALSAITVSSGSGSYGGTIISEKRIIPVAPMSTETVFFVDETICTTLENMRRINNYNKINWGNGEYQVPSIGKWNRTHCRLVEKGREHKMKNGFSRQYDESNTILSYKAMVRYSFSESMDDAHEAITDNYLKALVVDKRGGVDNYEYAELPYCDQYRTDTDNYTLFHAEKDGGILNGNYDGILLAIGFGVVLVGALAFVM